MLTNQTTILFSSEPDVTVLDKTGKSSLVIEVKGGTDPAGALERDGAAKKSFEASLRDNEHVKTCFLACCITPEVNQRIQQDSTFSEYFNLTEVLADEGCKSALYEYVFSFIEPQN